jgi:hypothetical protein
MNKMSWQERAHYHVISNDQVMRAVSGQETRLLVIPQWIIEYYHDLSAREIDEFHEAVDANYYLITEIRGVVNLPSPRSH